MVVILSLGSALAYGLSDYLGGVAARRMSPWAVAVVGQAISSLLILAASTFVTGDPTSGDLFWAAIAGVGSGAGAGFLYRGFATGRMGVVAPISAVGAALLPVAVGVATGERPSALTWLGVACALPAIWLVSRVEADGGVAAGRTGGAASGAVDGVLAGLGFGLLFAALGQVPDEAGLAPLSLTQAVAVLATIALALVLRARWLPARGRANLTAVGVGGLSAMATICFLLATQTGLLTVAAVLTSLYPALTVALAALLLREHIGTQQGVGLALAAAAVTLVAAG